MTRKLAALLFSTTAALAVIGAATPAAAADHNHDRGHGRGHHVTRYTDCEELNQDYRHGVGRRNAVDRTYRTRPVTNFTTDRAVYEANRRLDRDRDGIACETVSPRRIVKHSR